MEVDKIARQKLGARGWRGGGKGRLGERREKGRIEERVSELTLSHRHTDEYLEYHHRTFIW